MCWEVSILWLVLAVTAPSELCQVKEYRMANRAIRREPHSPLNIRLGRPHLPKKKVSVALPQQTQPRLHLLHESKTATTIIKFTFRRASANSRARKRECTLTGLRMIKPSLTKRRMFCRELALLISLTSLGSSQTFFLPHLRTLEAKFFWRRRLLKNTI